MKTDVNRYADYCYGCDQLVLPYEGYYILHKHVDRRTNKNKSWAVTCANCHKRVYASLRKS